MGIRLKLMVLASLVLIAVPPAQATKLYKWVDKDGNVSYEDVPPSDSGYRVEEKDLGARSAASDRTKQEVVEKFPVVLYSAPECGSCDEARAYLKSRGIPFSEKNVEGDRKLQAELIKKTGGLVVPTIMVGDKVMKGYLESLLEGELNDAGYASAGNAQRPKQPAASESSQAPEQQEEPAS